jgi:hypothetical protein
MQARPTDTVPLDEGQSSEVLLSHLRRRAIRMGSWSNRLAERSEVAPNCSRPAGEGLTLNQTRQQLRSSFSLASS